MAWQRATVALNMRMIFESIVGTKVELDVQGLQKGMLGTIM